MVEYSLCCDRCSRVILASKKSAADARVQARLMCGAGRLAGRDLCCDCIEEIEDDQ